MPRLYCSEPLASGRSLALPEAAARHAQVLRMQPGQAITLFDGLGGEYQARIERMGRSEVHVSVGSHEAVEREAPRTVHLALGVPANERMDWLVEKATELGVASIQPLTSERSVLRLSGERAAKKQSHWQSIAVAACEQCGRNRVPQVHALQGLQQWLASPAARQGARWLLSLRPDSQPVAGSLSGATPVTLLSGPEGGLATLEEDAALACGFTPLKLGARVLRAETAPLAALALLTLSA